MSLVRRLVTPVVLATLALSPWLGPGALCSCGGPAAPGEPAPSAAPLETPPAPTLPDFTAPGWTRTPSATGKYLVVWRTLGDSIPRNQDFSLEAWVLEDGQPRQVTQLGISAWMPDHGHGMLRVVHVEARPDGSYRADGLLLHMRGHWLLVFDVVDGTLSERAEHSLEL